MPFTVYPLGSTDTLLRVAIADGPNLSPFGGLRTSRAFPIFDSKLVLSNQDLFWATQVTSGGTLTWNQQKAQNEYAVTTTVGSKVIRQTKRFFTYQPGSGTLWEATGNLNGSIGVASGVSKKVGFFFEEDGIFFELDEVGVAKWVIRSSTSGSPVDSEAPQASWNLDPMDGTGPSGITVDLTKTQIWVIDLQWLGVGRVRVGLNIDGVLYYVHEFLHSNVLTEVYMRTPNLPIRYEIEQITGAQVETMNQICSAVKAEGSYNPVGLPGAWGMSPEYPAPAANATQTAILGMQLKSGYERATVVPVGASMASVSNANFLWEVVLNPSVATPSGLTIPVADSAVEIIPAVNPTNGLSTGFAITPGTGYVIDAGLGTRDTDFGSSDIRSALTLAANIAGTSDLIVLAATPDANEDMFASIKWKELL